MLATIICEDSKTFTNLVINSVIRKKIKCVDTKHQFTHLQVDYNSVQLVYTPADQLAGDQLKKALSQVEVEQQ